MYNILVLFNKHIAILEILLLAPCNPFQRISPLTEKCYMQIGGQWGEKYCLSLRHVLVGDASHLFLSGKIPF